MEFYSFAGLLFALVWGFFVWLIVELGAWRCHKPSCTIGLLILIALIVGIMFTPRDILASGMDEIRLVLDLEKDDGRPSPAEK